MTIYRPEKQALGLPMHDKLKGGGGTEKVEFSAEAPPSLK